MIDEYKVLFVEDDPTGHRWLVRILEKEGFSVESCSAEEQLEGALEESRCPYDVALVDYRLDYGFSRYSDGIAVTNALLQRWPELEVIAVSRFLEGSLGVSADRVVAEWVLAGARWFCRKQDFKTESGARRHLEVLRLCAQRVERLRRRFRPELDELEVYAGLEDTVALIDKLAHIPAPILLLGPTGVGKSYLARYIHSRSERSGPLISVNCGAIPESLAESELFGHVKGAFTGASVDKPGKFELADRGTIFLDEVGELPALLQTKLLHVLEDREVWRVGAKKAIPVDARIMAATNRDLLRAVEDGKFREDLFFRISVFPVRVPALAERRTDIRIFVKRFWADLTARFGRSLELADDAAEYLEQRDYPGNVRELENVIRRLVALGSSEVVSREEAIEIDQLALSPSRVEGGRSTIDTREKYVEAVIAWMKSNIDRLGQSPDLRTPTSFVRMAIRRVSEEYELVGTYPSGERYVLERLVRLEHPDLYSRVKGKRKGAARQKTSQ